MLLIVGNGIMPFYLILFHLTYNLNISLTFALQSFFTIKMKFVISSLTFLLTLALVLMVFLLLCSTTQLLVFHEILEAVLWSIIKEIPLYHPPTISLIFILVFTLKLFSCQLSTLVSP